jgi:hypothetical protein
MPKSQPAPQPEAVLARLDLARLRQAVRDAERRVEDARAPVARLQAEVAAAEAAEAEACQAARHYADRLAAWAESGQGASPVLDAAASGAATEPPALEARVEAARAAHAAVRGRLAAAELDLAAHRARLAPAITRVLRADGAALADEYWRRMADLEALRRNLAALDRLLESDYPHTHGPTGRPIVDPVSPDRHAAPARARAMAAACAGLATTAEFLATWRQSAATLTA